MGEELEVDSLFPSLSSRELSQIRDCSTVRNFKRGEFIFREGNRGNSFYVVASGSVVLESTSGFKKTLRPGDFFGEFAVFGQVRRTASARVLTEAKIFALGRTQLNKAFLHARRLKEYVQTLYARRFFHQVASQSLFFEGLSHEDLDFVFHHFDPLKLTAGKVLIKEGAESDRFYFILAGSCEVYQGSKFIRRMTAGHFFGEIGLLTRSARTATVKTSSLCSLLVCNREKFENLIRKIPKLNRVFKELGKLREPALAKRIESLGQVT